MWALQQLFANCPQIWCHGNVLLIWVLTKNTGANESSRMSPDSPIARKFMISYISISCLVCPLNSENGTKETHYSAGWWSISSAGGSQNHYWWYFKDECTCIVGNQVLCKLNLHLSSFSTHLYTALTLDRPLCLLPALFNNARAFKNREIKQWFSFLWLFL